jgi:hypothetical protein
VPGAGDDSLPNEALVEWATSVRTGLIESKKLSAISKNGEALAFRDHHDSLALVDILNRGDADPGHWSRK